MNKILVASWFLILSSTPGAMAANIVEVAGERVFPGTSYSLRVTYDGTDTPAFVQDNSPTSETRHSVDILLYADVSAGFTMAPNDRHQVFRARDPSTGTTVWRAHVRRIGNPDPISEYRLSMWCSHDGSAASQFIGELYLIPGKWQQFRLEWQAESTPGVRDGVCRLWKGSNTAGARERVDLGGTASFVVNTQQLGAFAFAENAGTAGSLYFSDFRSFRAMRGE